MHFAGITSKEVLSKLFYQRLSAEHCTKETVRSPHSVFFFTPFISYINIRQSGAFKYHASYDTYIHDAMKKIPVNDGEEM